MQIRSKAYLLMMSRMRALLSSSTDDPATKEPSPMLIFIAVVLALLLAILEVDQHSAALRSLGLLGDPSGTPSNFMGP